MSLLHNDSGFFSNFETEPERIERQRTRVLKSEPLDVIKVTGFIILVIGLCVVVGLVAGYFG